MLTIIFWVITDNDVKGFRKFVFLLMYVLLLLLYINKFYCLFSLGRGYLNYIL